MATPSWIDGALDEELGEDEELVEAEELDSGFIGTLAVVSTSDRGFVLRKRPLAGVDYWSFELEIPAGSENGELPADAIGVQEETETPDEAPFGRVYPAEQVEGIGETYTPQLEELGVVETDDLWHADAEHISERLDVPAKTVRLWQRMAALMTVDGIGPQYAELLARSGVHSVDDLAGSSVDALVDDLHAKQDEIDVQIQGNPIQPRRVASWIEAAGGEPTLDTTKQDTETGSAAADEPADEGSSALSLLAGIGPARRQALEEAGIDTPADLASADGEALAETLGVSPEQVEAWKTEVDLTAIPGIGPVREENLRDAGIGTLGQLIAADVDHVSEKLGVGKPTVVGWQREATQIPRSRTDLFEVSGIGPARARELIRQGFGDRESLAAADPAKVAYLLDVSEDRIRDWQEQVDGS